MKRRVFCTSALALAYTATSSLRVLAASSISSEIPITRGDGKQATLAASDVTDLKGSLRGELLLPSQSGCDQARKVWNGAFDRRPALIARCAGAEARLGAATTSVRGFFVASSLA